MIPSPGKMQAIAGTEAMLMAYQASCSLNTGLPGLRGTPRTHQISEMGPE